MRLGLGEWAPIAQQTIMTQTTWMGVPALRNPIDAWICQEILHEVRPAVVVEIGGFAGGGTLYLAHLLDILGHGVVVSVDVSRERWSVEHPRIRLVTGHSSDPTVVEHVKTLAAGNSTLVIHDGDHARPQVLEDLRAYAGLVSVGSYLIVEDGIVDLFPLGSALHPKKFPEGPMLAVRDFLKEDGRFELDPARERFLVTWNPGGYLRRVR